MTSMAQQQTLHPQSEPEPDEVCSSSNQNPKPDPTRNPTLLRLSFNQDRACFSVATDTGFSTFSCDPFRQLFRREGGVGIAEMLFLTNFIAVVGGGPDPIYPPNKVMMWNDYDSKFIYEISCRAEVKSVRLRRDRIVVVCGHVITVYGFHDLKLLNQIETIENPRGLCEVSQAPSEPVLVCPGLQKGQVRVEVYGSKRTKFVQAHNSGLACLALTHDGRLMATASSKGTLIRVFNTFDGSLLQEVRRGADRADIYSLAFSSTAQWLAVSSDKGTIHVFSLKVDSGSFGTDKPRIEPEISLPSRLGIPYLSFVRGVLPKYFSSEWSAAKFYLQEGVRYSVAFGHQKDTVVILGMDGSFYRCQFDPVNGGQMTQLEYHNFLKPEETFLSDAM